VIAVAVTAVAVTVAAVITAVVIPTIMTTKMPAIVTILDLLDFDTLYHRLRCDNRQSLGRRKAGKCRHQRHQNNGDFLDHIISLVGRRR
jgi:hypothetical protein